MPCASSSKHNLRRVADLIYQDGRMLMECWPQSKCSLHKFLKQDAGQAPAMQGQGRCQRMHSTVRTGSLKLAYVLLVQLASEVHSAIKPSLTVHCVRRDTDRASLLAPFC